MKYRIYNQVTADTELCPAGELLTDKELQRLRAAERPRYWPSTKKVKVKSTAVYFSFGVRFATEFTNF